MLFRRTGTRIVRSFAIRSSRCSKTKPLELPESFGRTAGRRQPPWQRKLVARVFCPQLINPFRSLENGKSMRKTRIVLAIVAAYLILILFGHLPDHLILFPTKAPLDAGEAARKMVPFQNGELEVWTAKSYRAKQQAGAET